MNVLDSFSLKGKVALVTGGAGKYGRQILEAVAEAGAVTYVAARNLEALQKEADKLNARGYDVRACKYDQGKEETIIALRDHIVSESGRIDVLVNNSVARIVDSWDNDPQVYQESLNINVNGVFSMCRAFGDVMKKQNSGSIINIGSIYGMVGYDPSLYIGTDMVSADPHPAYYVEKGGMIMLTKFIGSYLGQNNIRVNCISPGGYYTPDHNPKFLEKYNNKTFLGRMANDEDLKGIIVFLASDASAYVTGTNIPVDGGLTAK
ncbi:MAG: SDR family oxidoreductase [Clostridia bacterium]|jgi:NAD(P)-dependent dehydrogenase (short-subunit alcohol dehydrogenase family)|nr:SDR family oxidoreductase [Clostridia bacterium]MBT7122356.1 SDR family oxidoreductase [Clostridia bacterium]